MLPLIGLAATFLPDLIHLIAGDQAGTVAGKVTKAVADIAGTDDPVAAKQKLDADNAASAALRQRLAEIALEAAREQNAEADRQRADELATFKASIENTAGARTSLQGLVAANSPIAYASPAVSIVVTVGFFAILAALIWHGITTTDQSTINIINIAVGVLGTGFATVVNFWLGSSSGSRNKDAAVVDMQQTHAAQTGQLIGTLVTAQQTHAEQTKAAFQAIKDAAALPGSMPSPPAAPIPAAAEAPPSPDNFDRCVAVTLAHEGGFSQDQGDPGGATNFGITLKTLQEWRDKPVTVDDVRNLTRSEAIEIYRANYWNPSRCSELPPGVDLMVFDFGVNAGPRTAVKVMQRAVGVTEDGSVGPNTMKAVYAADPRRTIDTMATGRLDYYRHLDKWSQFGTGWTNRTNQVAQTALVMVV